MNKQKKKCGHCKKLKKLSEFYKNPSHPEAFTYANMCDLYTSGHGHGLQNNKPENYETLMKMCDKISQAVYDYQREKII